MSAHDGFWWWAPVLLGRFCVHVCSRLASQAALQIEEAAPGSAKMDLEVQKLFWGKASTTPHLVCDACDKSSRDGRVGRASCVTRSSAVLLHVNLAADGRITFTAGKRGRLLCSDAACAERSFKKLHQLVDSRVWWSMW